MKNLFKAILCIVAIVTMQSVSSAQIGYSVTDNNRDSTGLEQQYYSFDLATGQGTLIQNLGGIRREYEGMASPGSVLMGVAEFDTELCNTGSDPITGLSADVRIFTPTGVGKQVGETCIDFGGEAAAISSMARLSIICKTRLLTPTSFSTTVSALTAKSRGARIN